MREDQVNDLLGTTVGIVSIDLGVRREDEGNVKVLLNDIKNSYNLFYDIDPVEQNPIPGIPNGKDGIEEDLIEDTNFETIIEDRVENHFLDTAIS